jgi:acetyl esterase/lipase
MASLRLQFFNFVIRRAIRAKLARLDDPLALRTAIAPRNGLAPRGVRLRRETLGAAPGEWAESPKAEHFAHLLYLHGGGYIACSPRTHRAITGGLAHRGLRVYAPDYRLAPEHPYPAALEDSLAAFDALRARVTGPLLVGGDSAGGGLALALLMALRDRRAGNPASAQPDGAILFSPWTDLTGESPTIAQNAGRDHMFPGPGMEQMAALYAGSRPLNHPRVSPLHGDFSGLPPLFLMVGESEILLNDSRGAAEKAKAAGVPTQLQIWPDVPHVWPILGPFTPESRRALDGAAEFARAVAAKYQAA